MMDITTAATPQWRGWYDNGGTSWEIAVMDGSLVVADGDDGVLVLGNDLVLPSGVGDLPAAAALSVACRPNPCNPATTITFAVPRAGPVRVDILDARGARVACLLDRALPAGPARVVWRGRDDGDCAVASGVYLARVRTAGGEAAGKVVLLR